MKTPDEIKKGLECCVTDNCKGCPYYPLYEVFGCKLARAKDAIDLIQKLEEERDEMLETIKRMVTCGADCGGCVHLDAANATLEQCEDIDFDCENCKEKCACYGCENGSNYVWKGTEDSPEKE